MGPADVRRLRLRNQHLARPDLPDVAAVVAHLGAVQAQDLPAAGWALAMRTPGALEADVERALDGGAIVRTHVMRPTWHLVPPSRIRAVLALTASRVRALMRPYDRRLELDRAELGRAHAVVASALEGGHALTRAELGTRLQAAGIAAKGQRLGHIVMHAELDALVCNGPRRGRQSTYALLDERVPPTAPVPRDEALAALAQDYFRSHGPAQPVDFAWWSGLTVGDARAAIAAIAPSLASATVDGKTHWFPPDVDAPSGLSAGGPVHLLSIYDEYTIAYRDRDFLVAPAEAASLRAVGAALTSVIVLDGRIVGTWKRTLRPGFVEVALAPFAPPSEGLQEGVAAAATAFGRYLSREVALTWEPPLV